MSRQIIHIGIHKTSSTFFQENIFPNVVGFNLLTRPYTQHNHFFNKIQYQDDTLFDIDAVKNYLKNQGYSKQNLILSDESLSGKPLGYSYINRSMIAKRLKKLWPNATIIIFLRDQKDIIKSHYSSYIKMPFGVKTFEDFLWIPSKNDMKKNDNTYDQKSLYYNSNDFYLHADNFKYSELIKLYKELFSDVKVFLYEDFKKNQQFFLKKIKNELNIEVDHSKIILKNKVNKSLTFKDLMRRRKLNQISLLFKAPLVKKIIINSYKIFPYPIFYEKKLSDIIKLSLSGYYTKDNIDLKKLTPEIDWEKFNGVYK